MSKPVLLSVAALFFLLGIGVTYASERLVCVGPSSRAPWFDCLVLPEGRDGLLVKGLVHLLAPDPGTNKVIQQLPYLLYAIGGAFLIGGLVKSDRN